MKQSVKWIGVFILIAVLSLTFVMPARAFDGRAGDTITIAAGETVNDDLYISANVFTLDGTVKGDLVVFAQSVIINGTVEGDLMAAGQNVIINGKVIDDTRIAGYALLIDKEASLGDDLVSAGFSLETGKDTGIGGDLVFAGAQALLSGAVDGKATVATNGLELRGTIGGDLDAAVGEATQEQGMPPNMFMPQEKIQVTIPFVKPGLTLAPKSKIGGDLHYTQSVELNLPKEVVTGKITWTVPELPAEAQKHVPTNAERVQTWGIGLLRQMATLIIFGLFLGWLFPKFMKSTGDKLQAQFWPSLGWGVVTYAVFFFALFLVFMAMILGGVLFGALTLGGLSGTVIWVGLFLIFTGILGFVLGTAYVTKVMVGTLIGKWLLAFISPSAAEHKVWPMITGVILLVLVIGTLRFPLVPLGFFGWLLNFAVALLGLGAFWLWGRDRMAKQPEVSVPDSVQ